MSIRGRVAIVGVGETTYYKHGRAPESEFALALRAILSACEDAGIDPRQVDGFASYSNDRNDPSRLAAALGLPELRFSNMQWGGGGGGGSAAVGNAAAAVAAGYADCVVVFRALAQGQFQRFGSAPPGGTVSGEAALTFPYGRERELHRGGPASRVDGRPRRQGRGRGPELRELHRRRPHEPGRARLLRSGGGERVPDLRQPHRAARAAAAEHQRRQPRRVL